MVFEPKDLNQNKSKYNQNHLNFRPSEPHPASGTIAHFECLQQQRVFVHLYSKGYWYITNSAKIYTTLARREGANVRLVER